MSWCAKKQNLVARSSTESKYRALALSTTKVTWLQHLFREIQVSQSHCPIIWCDNIGTTCLAMNPVFHSRTKHIEIDLHFIRDKILLQDFEVGYVPTHDQIANLFTKPLSYSRFHWLRIKLNVG